MTGKARFERRSLGEYAYAVAQLHQNILPSLSRAEENMRQAYVEALELLEQAGIPFDKHGHSFVASIEALAARLHQQNERLCGIANLKSRLGGSKDDMAPLGLDDYRRQLHIYAAKLGPTGYPDIRLSADCFGRFMAMAFVNSASRIIDAELAEDVPSQHAMPADTALRAGIRKLEQSWKRRERAYRDLIRMDVLSEEDNMRLRQEHAAALETLNDLARHIGHAKNPSVEVGYAFQALEAEFMADGEKSPGVQLYIEGAHEFLAKLSARRSLETASPGTREKGR